MSNTSPSNAVRNDQSGQRGRNQVTLFYSYSHKDEKYRDKLGNHLALLKHQGLIKEWYDREIGAGDEWRDSIDEHLEAADIILLLVSDAFIASEYCWDKEMGRALERHNAGDAVVIPIIVRPVNWRPAPFGLLQALPRDGKPVTLWSNHDQAWADVAEGISKRAQALAEGRAVEPTVNDSSSLQALGRAKIKAEVPPAMQRPNQLARTIYTAHNTFTLPGDIVRQEGDPPTQDMAVDEAYDALGTIYDFLSKVYQRNSMDDQGMPLIATVHYQKNYVNAFWDGKQMVLGDGDQRFNRFTLIDVIAREVALGMVQYEVQFPYWGEAGALSVSISDVFGVMVKQYKLGQTADQADWLVGQGLFTSHVNGVALKSLKAPGTAYDDPFLGKDPQPAHMQEYVETDSDNGGVHINGGIPNHAFYLVATRMGGYAWEKAGKIWYVTLRDKLHNNAGFQDFAKLTSQTAVELFGKGSPEQQAVRDGWHGVGLDVDARAKHGLLDKTQRVGGKKGSRAKRRT